MKLAALMASTSMVLATAGTPALAQQADGEMVDQAEVRQGNEMPKPADNAAATATGNDSGGYVDDAETAKGDMTDASGTGNRPQSEASISGSAPVVALADWGYDRIYNDGLSYDVMAGMEVIGSQGEEIGDVENIVINDQGEIVSLIAEVGGFWDIGDTHVSVPWDEVEYTPMTSEIRIPVSEDNVDDYGMANDEGWFDWGDDNGAQTVGDANEPRAVDDDAVAGRGFFKASDIVGDYAYLTGNQRYGYVNDLVFTPDDGRLHAVVVNAGPGYGGGYYAYPWRGQAWNRPDLGYQLPYGTDDVTVIETLDYQRFRDGQQSASNTSNTMTDEAAAEIETDTTTGRSGGSIDEGQTSAIE